MVKDVPKAGTGRDWRVPSPHLCLIDDTADLRDLVTGARSHGSGGPCCPRMGLGGDAGLGVPLPTAPTLQTRGHRAPHRARCGTYLIPVSGLGLPGAVPSHPQAGRVPIPHGGLTALGRWAHPTCEVRTGHIRAAVFSACLRPPSPGPQLLESQGRVGGMGAVRRGPGQVTLLPGPLVHPLLVRPH